MATFWPQNLGEWAEVAGPGITALALVIAGLWTYILFVRKRQKYPRAKFTHKIIHRSVGIDRDLLRVTVNIGNSGDVLLRFVSGEVRVSQVLPLASELEESLRDGEDPVNTDEGETQVAWSSLGTREKSWKAHEFEIEPEETDEVHFDFILDHTIQTVEIYSYFKNKKKYWREIGWDLTTIHDIGSVAESDGTIDSHKNEE